MDFNWPPAEDELERCANNPAESLTGFDETSLGSVDPSLAPTKEEPHTTSVVLPEAATELFGRWNTPTPSDTGEVTACVRESAWFDVGPTRSAAEERPPSSIEDSTTSAMAGVRSVPASDGTRPSEWAAEIARLQALIEGLTQKVEWR
jgi:hypothetical protein